MKNFINYKKNKNKNPRRVLISNRKTCEGISFTGKNECVLKLRAPYCSNGNGLIIYKTNR